MRRPSANAARTVTVVLAALCAVQCGLQLPRRAREASLPVDPGADEWAATLDTARAAIVAGRYGRADSALTAFRARYAATPDGAEALYWRAVARFDAPEPAAGVRSAIADLDAYRASNAAPGGAPHLVEALALRRALVRLDSARTANAAAVAAPPAERPAAAPRPGMVPRDSLRAREEELQQARAEAAAAQAELERLRRRLAAPGRRP